MAVVGRLFTLNLQSGQSLAGADASVVLDFESNSNGICLPANTTLEMLALQVEPNRRAVLDDQFCPELDRIESCESLNRSKRREDCDRGSWKYRRVGGQELG